MEKNRLKLLYIAGYARCGSTILSNVLGEIDGFFNAGELMYMWDRIRSQDGICGCGDHVTECSVWKKVLDSAFGDVQQLDTAKLIQVRNRLWKSKHIPLWLLDARNRKTLSANNRRYFDALSNLYIAIGREFTGQVVIDTSKNPAYLYFLSLLEDVVDLYVVHIVRDSRATAYSWLRKKKGFRTVSTMNSAISWMGRNVLIDLLSNRCRLRYLNIKYERFVADPNGALNSIFDFVNEPKRSLDFISPDGIDFGENHCVFGNTDLFKRGKIKLKIDDEWKNMNRAEWRKATALTWPVLKRYGYSIF